MSAARLQPIPVNRPVSTHLALTHVSATLATGWMEMDGLVQVCIVFCGWITIANIVIMSLVQSCAWIMLMLHFYWFSEIHECDDNSHSCEHNCMNTAGGFVCSCFTGYTLASNGFSCLSMCKWGTCFCVYEHVWCGMFVPHRENVYNRSYYLHCRYRWVYPEYWWLCSHLSGHTGLIHLQLPPWILSGFWWTIVQW